MRLHERRYASLGMRLIGVGLIVLAGAVARHLFAGADPSAKEAPSAYLLALLFIASGSVGLALASLGRHLFDAVDVSARWTTHPPRAIDLTPSARAPRPSASVASARAFHR